MFNGYFEGKRILVTGVAGVKGAWLALALLDAGAEVLGLDLRLPEPDSNYVASRLQDRISFTQGDVTDLPLMQQLMGQADGIFHLAALALVHDAYRNPFEAYRTNTLGPATILEALRLSAAPKRAVFITTDKVYKPKNGELWAETDPLGASGPYAVSKACAELIIADYQRTYLCSGGSLIGVARAGNVLIGGDWHSSLRTQGAGRIFVDCFESLAENRAPEIFSPNFTRPYTYGLDILSGYMTLMSMLDVDGIAGEAFNFGPYEQHGVTNALLATKICELWGGNLMWRSGHPRDEPFEHQSLAFDKSRERLHWRPAYTLYEALRSTTRWYKEWTRQSACPGERCMVDFNRELLREHRIAANNLGIAWAAGDRARNLETVKLV
jgi:CDP-glucose 4,6-dehydratase